MSVRAIIGAFFAASLAFSLTGCGGGGGGGSGFTSVPNPAPAPSPTPVPTPTPNISLVKEVSGDITFAGKGAATTSLGSSYSLADIHQLVISYSGATKTYTVTIPGVGSSALLDDPNSSPAPGQPETLFVIAAGGYLSAYASFDGLQYSNLAGWSYALDTPNQKSGFLAFGIPTASGSIPVTGTASYSANLIGGTNETYFDGLVGGLTENWIQGTMDLSFDFAGGDLSGSLTAFLEVPRLPLGTFAFTNTVYASGSTTFSGAFVSPASGLNSFSGLFTGPAAQELIGNFQLPYISPVDGKPYQASGAFVGKRDGGL